MGHIISGDGITPVPEKLDSIQLIPCLYTPKEVKQFLGLVGYYRKFIPCFADLARPLNALTRKGVDFNWTPVCQKSFDLMHSKLTEQPIPVYPDPNKPYVLFTVASKYAWSCILTQEYEHTVDGKITKVLHPITYQSELFKGSQLNWACLNKEAYAIYMSVKKLEYNLVDADVTLFSDHLPLRKLVIIDPETRQNEEPQGCKFRYYVLDTLPPISVENIQVSPEAPKVMVTDPLDHELTLLDLLKTKDDLQQLVDRLDGQHYEVISKLQA